MVYCVGGGGSSTVGDSKMATWMDGLLCIVKSRLMAIWLAFSSLLVSLKNQSMDGRGDAWLSGWRAGHLWSVPGGGRGVFAAGVAEVSLGKVRVTRKR